MANLTQMFSQGPLEVAGLQDIFNRKKLEGEQAANSMRTMGAQTARSIESVGQSKAAAVTGVANVESNKLNNFGTIATNLGATYSANKVKAQENASKAKQQEFENIKTGFDVAAKIREMDLKSAEMAISKDYKQTLSDIRSESNNIDREYKRAVISQNQEKIDQLQKSKSGLSVFQKIYSKALDLKNINPSDPQFKKYGTSFFGKKKESFDPEAYMKAVNNNISVLDSTYDQVDLRDDLTDAQKSSLKEKLISIKTVLEKILSGG